jgi:urea-proton symporter
MGLLIGGAVFPTAFAITWKGQTRIGAISGCLVGLAAGLIAWLTTAKHYYGEITVATTGTEYATLAGNLAAIMTGLIVSVCVSLVRPDNFDWEITRAINALPVSTGTSPDDVTSTPAPSTPPMSTADEKKVAEEAPVDPAVTAPNPQTKQEEEALHISIAPEDSPSSLRRAFKLACISSFVITFILDFLIPMPMFFSHYIFSRGFFTGWVVISFIWVFCSSFISVVLPIWETRNFFGELWRSIRTDLRKHN